ncbi:MAG: baseplate J/gp47 family protein [Cyanomargarita calcarea GSE-NOS-MK-12-04C]|uniref:Baseplate J/gp47 family protein n=1 Tax=Cyanomargarita calcarea GSE-NOS-MK-12-04C TaxID=2839659 RepID=A0A951QSY2_9CYAN|nr:baseplate J/gp47 family protein [Cyanomargarita calcarea GSE-NOS-MK-12-04C]
MAIIHPEVLEKRAEQLASKNLNGMKLVLVTLEPPVNPTEAHLEVYFFNEKELTNIATSATSAKEIFPIFGGHRVLGGFASNQVQVTQITAPSPNPDQKLMLTVKPIGDYSTYTLSLNFPNIDPLFNQLSFKFRPGCFSTECAPKQTFKPAPQEPTIDYLAKDYDSFRHTMIAAMMQRVPDWQATSEADLDQVLLEIFSVAADELSDYQDRVMNEAYLASARKRVSLARHGRLMDYHIHQGNQGSTWVAIRVAEGEIFALPSGFLTWTGEEVNASTSQVFMSQGSTLPLFEIDTAFAIELNASTVSSGLRDRFLRNKIELSTTLTNLQVTIKETNQKWLLTDTEKQAVFLIKQLGSKLIVYAPDIVFEIDIAFTTELNAGTVSSELRDRFLQNNVTLSATLANLHVTVKPSDQQWLLTDTEKHEIFFIKQGEDKLNVYAPDLHPWLNEIELYTWNGAIPSLAAGSTKADLKLIIPQEIPARYLENLIRRRQSNYLVIQEWLNPETGLTAGRDPTKRQLLKLLPGKAAATAKQDPFTGDWFVQVQWEEKDKLQRNYCFTIDCATSQPTKVSLFHGNLVKVHHGRPRAIAFKAPGTILGTNEYYYQPTKRWGTICSLPPEPLAYKATLPGGEIPPQSTLEVTVSLNVQDDRWDEVIDLIHSDDSAEAGDRFIVETDELRQSIIRFGNDKNGRKLPSQATVKCNYQVGLGLDGNIGSDTLLHGGLLVSLDAENRITYDATILQPASPGKPSVWNPFDVTNGRAPEPVTEIIRRVPEAYRFRQLRAITLQDYVKRAEELPEVSKAAARYAWTGSWRTVQIAIDPVGTTLLDDTLREELARHLNAVRLIGEDLEIRPPRFVPLDIRVKLCIHPEYWPEDIKFLLEQEFSDGFTPDGRMGFFHPDRWTFGQELHASQILGRIQAIEGVEHVIAIALKRWNEKTPGTDKIAHLRSNEIIEVRNDPDHMEKGFIEFKVKGGRQ